VRRLDPYQLVSVNLPIRVGQDDVLDFRVVAMIDSVVALEPLEGSRTPMRPDRVRDCFMAFGHHHGLVGLKGHLYQRTPGDWRFKVTDPVSFPAESDFRIPVSVPITVAPYEQGATEGTLEASTVNLGADGVLVSGGRDCSPPEHVRLTLSLPGEDEAIQTPARLLARRGALHDFKYETISTEARSRLGNMIIQCQRYALRQRWAS
jgi:PilZ domain